MFCCIFCDRHSANRYEFVELSDSSFACRRCFYRSREESLARWKEENSDVIRERRRKDKDFVFIPRNCELCESLVTDSFNWMKENNCCRKCRSNMRYRLRPVGQYFLDDRKRVIKSVPREDLVEFAYGLGRRPKGELLVLNNEIGLGMLNEQRKTMFEFVEHWLYLIPIIASKFGDPSSQTLYDVGFRTLCKCALLFEEGKSGFENYARRALNFEYLKHKKKLKPPISPNPIEELRLSASGGVDCETRELVRRLEGLLSVEDLNLLVLHYGHGYSYRDVANIKGYSVTTVRRRILEAMEHAREIL